MSERWVDAFNVIHRLPRLAALLETNPGECRARFLEALAPLALRSREQWTVVFDGPQRAVERAPGRLCVVTAPDADGWILAALARHPQPGEVTIVTSDERDIGGPARARGARVMAADELVAALERRRRRREAPSADAAAEKPEAPNEEEVRYWLERFGAGDADRADSRGDADGADGDGTDATS
ncbi:MAG: NYN domain-containing protein [Candidatus Krumholzibacteriota bacterium]|nr:NYN domain-containing protein [Candidatus Krumholzibacteriota bacterium]